MAGRAAQAARQPHQQAISNTAVAVVLPVAARLLEVVAADRLAQAAPALPLLQELQPEQGLRLEVGREAMAAVAPTGVLLLQALAEAVVGVGRIVARQ